MKLVTTVKILSKAAQMAVHWPRSSSHCRSLLFLPPRHLHLLFACDRISLCKTALSSQPDPYSSQVLVFSKHSNVAPNCQYRCFCQDLSLSWAGPAVSWLLPIFLYLPEFFLNLSHLPSISLTQFLIKTLCPLKMSSLPFSFNSHLFFCVVYVYFNLFVISEGRADKHNKEWLHIWTFGI